MDLHECYDKYVNLKGVEKIDYITYLTEFDRLFVIPKDKKGSDYRSYISMLLEYLFDFTKRVKPLLDINAEMQDVKEEFDGKFKDGDFPGWPKETGGALTHTGAHLDLSAFSSPEELASLGKKSFIKNFVVFENWCRQAHFRNKLYLLDDFV